MNTAVIEMKWRLGEQLTSFILKIIKTVERITIVYNNSF